MRIQKNIIPKVLDYVHCKSKNLREEIKPLLSHQIFMEGVPASLTNPKKVRNGNCKTNYVGHPGYDPTVDYKVIYHGPR